MSDNVKRVLLVGAGNMAEEYVKILKDLDVYLEVIGNGKKNAEKIRNEYGVSVSEGGLENYMESNDITSFDYAINAVNTRNLGRVSVELLRAGVKNCLIEKPGFISKEESEEVLSYSADKNVYIAYNRRFYESVNRGREIIKEDGGVKSFSFEFTEWRHVFDSLPRKEYLEYLFLANSSHVVDLAFFLAGGLPETVTSIVSGAGTIDWHRNGCIFSGAGKTDNGAVFSYSANWDAPGRWGIEINTRYHRLIYRPLEKLQLMDVGSVRIYESDIDYSLDEKYKPGLFREVESFLNGESDKLCNVKEQADKLSFYEKISGEEY